MFQVQNNSHIPVLGPTDTKDVIKESSISVPKVLPAFQRQNVYVLVLPCDEIPVVSRLAVWSLKPQ